MINKLAGVATLFATGAILLGSAPTLGATDLSNDQAQTGGQTGRCGHRCGRRCGSGGGRCGSGGGRCGRRCSTGGGRCGHRCAWGGGGRCGLRSTVTSVLPPTQLQD